MNLKVYETLTNIAMKLGMTRLTEDELEAATMAILHARDDLTVRGKALRPEAAPPLRLSEFDLNTVVSAIERAGKGDWHAN